MAKKRTKSVGAVAVDLGYTSIEHVNEALKEQRNRTSNGEDHTLIGKVMEEMGALTPEQLFRVLSKTGDVVTDISEDAIRLAGRLRSSAGDAVRVITVTSAARHEGVTTVAHQLATALALMIEGAVLLVDNNLHNPKIHSLFNIPQAPGFTDVVESRATLGQACKRTQIPGLWVLPAGEQVENLLITLMNDACAQTLENMCAMPYRYFIIDTSPVLGYSDAALTAARSDATLLVVHANKRRKSEVVEMQRLLEGLNVNIIGALLRK